MSDISAALTPTQLAGLLGALPLALRAETEALGNEGARWHPAPGEWCVNEVVGHLLEAERRGFAGRIRRILEHPGCTLEPWDELAVARARRDCERDGLELVRELEAEREDSLRLVAALREDQLDLSGEHPQVGELHIRDLLHYRPYHDRNHLKQILSNIQAHVWPHMGNAQRFSEVD